MPIDSPRVQSWLDRFEGYRITVTDARIRSWISNFQGNDSDLGARVLDAVTFVRYEDMEEALQYLVSALPGWNKDKTQRKGRWRFVAFSMSAGESGDLLLNKSRTALGLTSRRFDEVFIYKADLLRERLGPTDNVVFIDDFAGTGEQASRAWPGLMELLPENPKTYLLLIAAGERAIRIIEQETKLYVRAKQVLKSTDDIFSDDCRYFTDDEKRRLLSYCRRADRRYPRGYGNCGFLFVLANKTPNNSIPVLHADHRRWVGLFPRG